MIPHSRSGYLRVCKVKRGSLDMAHRFSLRVYYEDTDFGGIVYYANYLKFIERARSEWVRSLGLDQKTLKSERGVASSCAIWKPITYHLLNLMIF